MEFETIYCPQCMRKWQVLTNGANCPVCGSVSAPKPTSVSYLNKRWVLWGVGTIIVLFVLFIFILPNEVIDLFKSASFIISLFVVTALILLGVRKNKVIEKNVLFLLFVGALFSMGVYGLANNSWDTDKPRDPNEEYFSGWNGPNPELVKIVKLTMNDPDSFQHVSTGTKNIDDDIIRIQMVFRGKNAFGGIFTKTVTADFTKSTRTIDNVIFVK